MGRTIRIPLAVGAALVASACGSMMKEETVAAPQVPAAIAVPEGHKAAMILKGSGQLTYECRSGGAGYQWAFVGPDAVLTDSSGARAGRYYGGPTWEHKDGSAVTGKQIAVASAAAGNIPLQLVQALPFSGGAFSGTRYIQRVNTQGGVAPSEPCSAATVAAKRTVPYSADYVFYKE